MRSRFWIAPTLLLALASCAQKHPLAPAAATPAGPAANSPAGVVQRFAWAWQQRDTALYHPLLTDDFRFIFAPSDSAGNPYRDHGWDQMLEALVAAHMFAGGGVIPPISDLQMTIDNRLLALSDPRPGKDPRVHQSVRTHVNLKITLDQNGSPNVFTVQGYSLFCVVRGDSATLTPARATAGGAGSTRWYIERWEDETAGANIPGMHADPARQLTLGALKAMYVPTQARPAP